ncbi:MAG: DivIVA domain-containing protein [Firmicutes bacterium]|jgi:cell division initiation protein|nr:DivIVA domain-containing protein [Bacillota bacterium]MCR4719571.1 DivIVA domain-containing protein [Bacillota bacterium]HAL63183.1 septum formation initiator [Clostridiales bacterium]
MLTPIDIQRQDFEVKLRGYNADEVDDFLDLVGRDYEKLYKDNAELREEIKRLNTSLEQYKNMEATLQQSIVLAQTAAEDIKKSAAEKANVIVNEAQTKSEGMYRQLDMDIQNKKNELSGIVAEVSGYKTRIKGICSAILEMLEKME